MKGSGLVERSSEIRGEIWGTRLAVTEGIRAVYLAAGLDSGLSFRA